MREFDNMEEVLQKAFEKKELSNALPPNMLA